MDIIAWLYVAAITVGFGYLVLPMIFSREAMRNPLVAASSLLLLFFLCSLTFVPRLWELKAVGVAAPLWCFALAGVGFTIAMRRTR